MGGRDNIEALRRDDQPSITIGLSSGAEPFFASAADGHITYRWTYALYITLYNRIENVLFIIKYAFIHYTPQKIFRAENFLNREKVLE